jgi:hypothetical protein
MLPTFRQLSARACASWMRSSGKVLSIGKWPDNTFPFNRRFVGDTLVLRSMTTDGDGYYFSKGELRLLKRSW